LIVIEFRRRTLLYPAMVVLFGTVAMPAGFAREHARNAHGPAHHATPDSAKNAKNGEANFPIGLQHDGANDHDHAAAGRKPFKIVPSDHPHVLATKPPAGSTIVGRNAIGLPIARREVVNPVATLPFSHFQTQPPGAPAGVSGLAHGNPATTQFAAPHPNPPPPNLNAGRIGGTAMIRHPATGVGGPSIPVGGINGTAFVRKH
jgi:hypothetical protein